MEPTFIILLKAAKKNKVKVGICDQGPAGFTDFIQFLIKEEIDAISVIPDALIKTVISICKLER